MSEQGCDCGCEEESEDGVRVMCEGQWEDLMIDCYLEDEAARDE